jgi:DNA-binding CsgD family transcriptional regulator
VESVEELVREIVTRVAAPSSVPAADDGVQRIVSVNVDGRQYTLTCLPSKATPALSPREQEIVRLVAQGLPNKCIGAVLDISAWTVATHLRRIFAKLGVTSRAAMIAKSMKE